MRRLSQILAVIVGVGACGVVLLIGLIGVQYWRNDRPIVLPRPRGANPVGRIVFDWTDARRSREMMVFAWYPAQPGAGGHRAEYIPGRWGARAAEGYLVIPARRMQAIEVSAINEAPVAPGRHPILVLLPAMGVAPARYTTWAEDLASHGYIVAGVTPTGSTKNVVFPSGRVVDSSQDPDASNAEIDRQVMRTWCDDAEFSLDQLLLAEPLADAADAARAGIAGHAFGGAVAMQVLKTSARFKAAANLGGAPWREPPGTLARPLLILAGVPSPGPFRPFAAGDAIQLRAVCQANRARCEMHEYERAFHGDFADDAVLPSRFPLPNVLIGRGRADGLQFQREIADRLLAFFGRSL